MSATRPASSQGFDFDVIFVMPSPFADHPSFPEGLLRRALETAGFRVGIIQTPDWRTKEGFVALSRPRLFFAVISGPVDSMVLNYTSSRKRRMEDLYQIDGRAFFPNRPRNIGAKIRPDRTVIVFANRLREAFGPTPIVIGGMEASMRRFVHYDFQPDSLRRSILLDSRADLLVTGMGEKAIVSAARLLDRGGSLADADIPGSAQVVKRLPPGLDIRKLPSHEAIRDNPVDLIRCRKDQDEAMRARIPMAQPDGDRWILEYPPESYSTQDLDGIYGAGYSLDLLDAPADSPALTMNRFSVTSHRGCAGACAFCSIGGHTGNHVVSRTPDSILDEIRAMARHRLWKGIVFDVGGASAEMFGMDCRAKTCRREGCLVPDICSRTGKTTPYLALLRRCREIPGVRKIGVGSGFRHDLLLRNPELLEEILRFHAGRFLRVAPEHTEDHVLALMNKPRFDTFAAFVGLFKKINSRMKRPVELAPYIIVGHPGETAEDVAAMKRTLRKLGLGRADVQIFTPTPGTLSTAMFYARSSAGGEPLPVEIKVPELLRRQRSLMEWG